MGKVRRYASRFWLRSGGEKLATFRHVAKRFAIKLEDVETLVEDCELGWNCGIQIPGGAGYAVADAIGDYTVEPEDEVADGFWRRHYAAHGISTTP